MHRASVQTDTLSIDILILMKKNPTYTRYVVLSNAPFAGSVPATLSKFAITSNNVLCSA